MVRQLAIRFDDQFNRFFEILVCLVKGSALSIGARQLFYLARPPVAILFEDGRKCRYRGYFS
jgi:hypothetical protein